MIKFPLLLAFLIGVHFSPLKRAYVVESMIQQNHWKDILKKFEEKFGKKISKSQVYKINNKFKSDHTCHNLILGRSGRKKAARSPENILAVKQLLEGEYFLKPDQHKSSARRNILAGITKSSFSGITNLDLKLKPYHLLRHQMLTPDQKVPFFKIRVRITLSL